MITTLIWIGVGVFIGWNIPQPSYAKALQEKIIAYFKS